MASLLVDLHRNGVYWGDCSLANTLFSRDGQRLQAWLVDAETSEIHPELTAGQRNHDLDILTENVAGGLLDLAMMLDRPPEIYDQLVDEAASVATRYRELWDVLHEEPLYSFADRIEIEGRIRRLNDMGFAVDEVELVPTEGGDERLRLKVTVAAAAVPRRASCSSSPASRSARARRRSCWPTCGPTRRRCASSRAGCTSAPAAASRRPRPCSCGSTSCCARAWSGRTRPSGASATRCRPTATCSRCAGCSASRPGFDVGDGAALDALANRVAADRLGGDGGRRRGGHRRDAPADAGDDRRGDAEALRSAAAMQTVVTLLGSP